MSPENIANWRPDWEWGVPLIVSTVMIHAAGLGFIKRRADKLMPFIFRHQALSIGGVTLTITLLHGLEAFIWALAFLVLKAVPDKMSATLYSMNALTAFGHTDLKLARPWQLLGAMESLNGWILFGLSTAYLFALIQSIWTHARPGPSLAEQISELLTIERRSAAHKASD